MGSVDVGGILQSALGLASQGIVGVIALGVIIVGVIILLIVQKNSAVNQAKKDSDKQAQDDQASNVTSGQKAEDAGKQADDAINDIIKNSGKK